MGVRVILVSFLEWIEFIITKLAATQAGTFVGAFIGATLAGLGLWRWLGRRWYAWWMARYSKRDNKALLKVHVADLEGDSGGWPFSKALWSSLHVQLTRVYGSAPISVERYYSSVAVSDHLNAHTSLRNAHERAGKLASECGSDILVWGSVLATTGEMTLYYTFRESLFHGPEDLGPMAGNSTNACLGEEIALALALQLQTRIGTLRQELPVNDDKIKQQLNAAEVLADTVPDVPTSEEEVTRVECAAMAHETYGAQRGDVDALKKSVLRWRQSASYWKSRSFDVWYERQNSVCTNLRSLATVTHEIDPLRQAATTLEETLAVISDAEKPELFSDTSQALSEVYRTIGVEERDELLLAKTVQTLTVAAELWSRDVDPFRYATLLDDLGRTHSAMAEIVNSGSKEHYKAAVDQFSNAMSVWYRDGARLRWAQSRRSMADNLSSLGELEHDTNPIIESIQLYAEVDEILTRSCDALEWAITQNNLANAHRKLATVESDPAAKLLAVDNSIDRYSAALEVRKPDLPAEWRMTMANFATSLRIKGRLTSNSDLLKQSVCHFGQILEKCSRRNLIARLETSSVLSNRGVAKKHLAMSLERRDIIESALDDFRESLKLRSKEDLPLLWARTTFNSALASYQLSRMTGQASHREKAARHMRRAGEVFEALQLPTQQERALRFAKQFKDETSAIRKHRLNSMVDADFEVVPGQD